MPPLELGAILNELAQEKRGTVRGGGDATSLLALGITDSKESRSDGPRPQPSHTNSDYAGQNPCEFFKTGTSRAFQGGGGRYGHLKRQIEACQDYETAIFLQFFTDEHPPLVIRGPTLKQPWRGGRRRRFASNDRPASSHILQSRSARESSE